MKARNYRLITQQAYTRKEYIHSIPQSKITKFTMGNPTGQFKKEVSLIAETSAQIRHNALEAARIAANKYIHDKVGEKNYCLQIYPYPHHILRENKMMAFAGADRLQEGMRRAFGNPVGLAARVKRGQKIISIKVNDEGVEIAKEALRIANSKLPIPCRTLVSSI